ncbi:MAG: hypothetical protein BWY02_02596 [bacterium ADurb.Bin157]|nr:MAG: hypothetical protein BWY02_02596 [bacterium ADurb.Bin157]
MCSLPLRILIVLASSALLWFGYDGLKDGQVRVKGGGLVKKEDSPINYWISVAIYFIAGCGGLLYAFFSN